MKAQPTIQKFMTTLPHTIGADQSLARARDVMTDLHVRHLPVLEGGQLKGILTERDIRLVESLSGTNLETTTVAEAYTAEPYTVSPTSDLKSVCAEMAEHKYGCALVLDNKKLVGIFTWVDALIAVQDVLDSRFKH